MCFTKITKMTKNWKGNSNSIFKTLGASNHTNKERELFDYYATDPIAGRLLMEQEKFNNIWECACGEGHLADELKAVKSTDIIDRGYGTAFDFLSIENQKWDGDIITNPPYKYAKEFIEKALMIIPDGRKVAMFLKLQFLESKGRKTLFVSHPPKTLYVSSSRILCAKNAEFEKMRKGGGSAVAYGWYVWEKGFNGNTIVRWIN